MVLETDTERAGYFDLNEHGTEITLFPDSPNETVINGLFENEYADILDVEGTTPFFWARTIDLDAVRAGSLVKVDTTYYTVVRTQPDNTGITIVILKHA